jgi:hypothetical protein
MKRVSGLVLLGGLTLTGSALTGSALTGCGPACSGEPGVACQYIGVGGDLGLTNDGADVREAEIYWAMDMEFAPDGTPYFIDWNNHLIRRVVDGRIETVVGDLDVRADGQVTAFAGDGPVEGNDIMGPVAGTDVRLNHPTDLQFDNDGNLVFAAWHNHKLRRVGAGDMCQTMLGRGAGYAGDDGPYAMALLNQPNSLVYTSDDRIFILDQRNFRIRMIDAAGTMHTVVGAGTPGFSGDGGDPLLAQLRFEAGPNPEPSGGIAYDEENDLLYIADGLNHVIRRVDFGRNVIETVVGTPETAGYGGDGGPGRSAQINHVRNVEIGPDGRIYFADTENDRVRAWDPATDVVVTVVGTGERALGADGVQATEVALNRPMGVAFGPDGTLYVGDTLNSRYLRIAQ